MAIIAAMIVSIDFLKFFAEADIELATDEKENDYCDKNEVSHKYLRTKNRTITALKLKPAISYTVVSGVREPHT